MKHGMNPMQDAELWLDGICIHPHGSILGTTPLVEYTPIGKQQVSNKTTLHTYCSLFLVLPKVHLPQTALYLNMRGFFSGNRHSAPLGPSKGSVSRDTTKGETLQAVRHRQREKQRQFVMQMMRAEKERDVAQEGSHTEKALAAEATRRRMSDSADSLAQQVMIIERIMEEFGLTVDMEEEMQADLEMLEESREATEIGLAEAEQAVQENVEQSTYISTMASPFMMPSDVYDEDEAMRDLDECAKQTGRA